MYTISLDAHAATFTMATWSKQGKLSQCISRPTSEENLIELISELTGPKQLVVEESHLAQWVKRTLERYVDKLIICDPRHNRWIAQDDFADDRTSAIKLGQLLLGGYIKEIYHPDEQGAQLRSLFIHYCDLNTQMTRFKNKLKATFRQIGVATPGKGIYESENRKQWLQQLKEYPHLLHTAKHLFCLTDSFEEMKQQTYSTVVKIAGKQPAHKLIQTIPGAGPLIAAGYIAIIDTPYRFSRKNKLWRYACLGNTYHVSDNIVYKKGRSKSGNRILKWLVMQHFQAAVVRSRKPNRFKRQYEQCILRGLAKKEARRDTCRHILSTVRAIWMKEEHYRKENLREFNSHS